MGWILPLPTGNFGGFGRESSLHRNGPETRISFHCTSEYAGTTYLMSAQGGPARDQCFGSSAR